MITHANVFTEGVEGEKRKGGGGKGKIGGVSGDDHD
jgi:hypothetical protein